ncbi:MAG: hypothetical protein FWD48_07025 [Oscillospiraceae bacterium]|nr:hypothetical protein [Oscillospiraceae bacterium]
MKNLKSHKWLIIGLVLFIIGILFSILHIGELQWVTRHSFIFCMILIISFAFGLVNCKDGFSLFKISRGVRIGALYAGGICFMVAIIATFHIAGEVPEETGYRLTYALNSVLYGLLISAGARIAEIWLTRD